MRARNVADRRVLMVYPFFSLAKTKRIVPIDFRAGGDRNSCRSRAGTRHGDPLGCRRFDLGRVPDCRSRDAGLKTSRLMAATPYEILTFVGRGTSARDYDRLKAGLDSCSQRPC